MTEGNPILVNHWYIMLEGQRNGVVGLFKLDPARNHHCSEIPDVSLEEIGLHFASHLLQQLDDPIRVRDFLLLQNLREEELRPLQQLSVHCTLNLGKRITLLQLEKGSVQFLQIELREVEITVVLVHELD